MTNAIAHFYPAVYGNLFNGKINVGSDTIKMMICTSSYTPSTAHDFKNDITNEASGTGYASGGMALTSVTAAMTLANSWGSTAAVSTAYAVDTIVRPASANGFLYFASTAGTSGSSVPAWPTVIGATVTDGTVVWTCAGTGVLQFSSATATWPTSAFTGRYAIIYDYTSGASDSTRPLICWLDMVTDQMSGDGLGGTGNFVVAPDAYGFITIFAS